MFDIIETMKKVRFKKFWYRPSTLELLKQYAEALKREQAENIARLQLFKDVFDSLPFVVYAVDLETYKIAYMNDCCRKTFGDREGAICHRVFQGLNQPCDFCTNDKLIDFNKAYLWKYKNRDGVIYHIADAKVMWVNGETKEVRFEIAIPSDIFDNVPFKEYVDGKE